MSQILEPGESFVVDQFNDVLEIYPTPTFVDTVTKIWKFLRKICYNLTFTGDMSFFAPDGVCGVG